MDAFDAFVNTIKQLRAPGGCPWDIEQTYQSLTPFIIEEAYELADAMRNGNMTHLREELGDVLLHVVMLANMASETNDFTITDVVSDIHDKMIRRHPHVFGNGNAENSEDVKVNWEKIKKEEKKDSNTSLFSSIPVALPALARCQKISKKVCREGFDWNDVEGPLDKVQEELNELKDEIYASNPDQDRIEDEIGDVFFSMVNVSRKCGVNAEEALQKANQKFIRRYETMSHLLKTDGKTLNELSDNAMLSYWENAKKRSP